MTNERFTKQDKTKFARNLRKNCHPVESLLWEHLRASKLGVKFRRRSVVYGFIPPFYCPAARLVIEIGVDIPETAQNSPRRLALTENGIRTFYVTYSEIISDFPAVLKRLKEMLYQHKTRP